MLQFLQPLYSTARYYLSQYPDLEAFVQIHRQVTNYDREGLTIKLASAEDFHRLVATVDKFRDGSRIAERTRRGDVCVVAYKHGELAHFRWAALSPLSAWGDYTVHLAADEAYTYDAFTFSAFRRQGISSEAKAFLMTYLTQQGIRCAYTDSRLDNRNTQHIRSKRLREGRQRVLGVITVVTRLGRTRCRFDAETADTRPIIARLYSIPQETISIRSTNRA